MAGAPMNTMSVWHWLIVIIYFVLIGVPVARILGRLGLSRWWVVLAFVPILNLIGLWILAFIPWRADSTPADRALS
jgi:hypothetical protein